MLDWAASGAMALTGQPDGAPVPSPAPVLAMLATVTEQLAPVTGETGKRVRADPAELITGARGARGLTADGGRSPRAGRVSCLRSADGWCAVTLSRPDDLAAVPAILGVLGLDPGDLGRAAPAARARGARSRRRRSARPAEDLAAAAQLLGVPGRRPAAARGCRRGRAAGRRGGAATHRAAVTGRRLAGAVVADLSSMWAGPLCARLLGLAGADVIKVESPDRPDGARSGNREFFDWLHAGHRSLAADFRTAAGRAALKALLGVADIVIEASRPRALAALGWPRT